MGALERTYAQLQKAKGQYAAENQKLRAMQGAQNRYHMLGSYEYIQQVGALSDLRKLVRRLDAKYERLQAAVYAQMIPEVPPHYSRTFLETSYVFPDDTYRQRGVR